MTAILIWRFGNHVKIAKLTCNIINPFILQVWVCLRYSYMYMAYVHWWICLIWGVKNELTVVTQTLMVCLIATYVHHQACSLQTLGIKQTARLLIPSLQQCIKCSHSIHRHFPMAMKLLNIKFIFLITFQIYYLTFRSFILQSQVHIFYNQRFVCIVIPKKLLAYM